MSEMEISPEVGWCWVGSPGEGNSRTLQEKHQWGRRGVKWEWLGWGLVGFGCCGGQV